VIILAPYQVRIALGKAFIYYKNCLSYVIVLIVILVIVADPVYNIKLADALRLV